MLAHKTHLKMDPAFGRTRRREPFGKLRIELFSGVSRVLGGPGKIPAMVMGFGHAPFPPLHHGLVEQRTKEAHPLPGNH